MRRILVVLAAIAVGVAAAWVLAPDDPKPSHVELRDGTPEPAELIDVDYPGPGLLALRQWTPERNVVLVCENWERMLPMRPADLWVTARVPESGRVLVVVSAETANSEPELGDHWGVMVDGEVVARGEVGRGDVPHRVTARFVIDGLAPGETRFDIAHRSDEGGTANLFLGPSYGPAVIEVWSA